jgi:glycerophosphoryl diester phosphodiesterase
VPGTHIPTLAEVFELADRQHAGQVRFNIETKLDPDHPRETVTPSAFASRLIEVIERHGMTRRATLESFDWRTLVAARRLAPAIRRAALVQRSTIRPGTGWTAGIRIPSGPFDGDLARIVAQTLHAGVLSPRAADVTDHLITRAHRFGLAVIPWTVNQEDDMASLIERGADGLISDYPDRLREVAAVKDLPLPQPVARLGRGGGRTRRAPHLGRSAGIRPRGDRR